MMGTEYQYNLESDLEMLIAKIHEVIWTWTEMPHFTNMY